MIKPALFAVLLLIATGATADETYVATLAPVSGTGSSGTGTATLTLSSDHSQISYNITFGGLLAAEVQAHIHVPSGSIAHPLPLGSPKIGVWDNPGLVNVAFLQGEQLYILIHSLAVPTGEIRGNIVAASTPTESATWGRIKALFQE